MDDRMHLAHVTGLSEAHNPSSRVSVATVVCRIQESSGYFTNFWRGAIGG